MSSYKIKRVFNIYGREKSTGFAGNVYDVDGIAPTINTCGGGNREPLIIEWREPEMLIEMNEVKEINPLKGVTDKSVPKVMSEFRSVLKSKQTHAFDCVKSIEEPSPTITAAMGMGGGMVPMLTNATIEECKTDNFMKQARKSSRLNLPEELKGKKFRIRKLTPRECFRLMGVEESDIDIIQSSGVSNSGQYKLAGNSIVVDVLYHIFRKAFVETENESKQLSLF